MRTYLVKYKPEDNSPVINDRIRNAGNYYALANCEFLVQSEYSTAQELYNYIVKDDYKTLSIVVLAIDARVVNGYWGVSKNELWDWLKENGVNL